MEIIHTYFSNGEDKVENFEVTNMKQFSSRLLKKNIISLEGAKWLIDLVARNVNL